MKSSTLVLLVVVFAASALCAYGLRCETRYPCVKYELKHYRRRVTFSWWGNRYVYYVWSSRWVSKNTMCTRKCPALDCVWGEWDVGEWSDCDVKCGIGKNTRVCTRTQIFPEEHGGKCPGLPTRNDKKTCDMKDCPKTICAKSKKAGHYTHLQECSKFVQCDQNGLRHYVKDCQKGTAWDSHVLACTSEALEACQGKLCERGALYMHGQDCRKFMKCDHNKMHELTCPGERPYFASELQTCVSDPSFCNVKIDDKDVLITDSECDTVGESTMDKSSCTNYYVCNTNHRKTNMPCPSGLVFDATTNKCAETNGRPECKKNKKCTNGAYIEDTSDNTKYYRCVHGVKVSQPCPPGLIFVQSKGFIWAPRG